MASVEQLFPVCIYIEQELFSVEQNRKWKERAIEVKKQYQAGGKGWEGGTYTTNNTRYSLHSDAVFTPLVEAVTEHVNKFTDLHCSDFTYKPLGGWLNISNKGDFQEFHAHNDSIMSAVYYISTPVNSGNIVFEDPKQPDMLPLRNLSMSNNINADRITYEPREGMLLVFRSYLRHMVTKNMSDESRVSIAFNF